MQSKRHLFQAALAQNLQRVGFLVVRRRLLIVDVPLQIGRRLRQGRRAIDFHIVANLVLRIAARYSRSFGWQH